MKIVISGGGLVGLTTAAALHRLGHSVTVLEQAPDIRAAGAGIGLWENALREYDAIGLGGAVRGLGQPVDTWFYDPAGHPLRAAGSSPADYQFLLVPRPELNRLLAAAIGPSRIRLGARALGFTEHASGVTVSLSSGDPVDADLLIGADGAFSKIREQLLPGSAAREHTGHFAWRAIVPAGGEQPASTVLTVGRERTRGGYTRVAPGQTMWMVNQLDSGPLAGTKRDRALARAQNLASGGWQESLLAMIAATPEEAILENQIMYVPPLPRWTSERVALIGDAAHALSPHIAAGGTLGVEDIGVLRGELAGLTSPASPDPAELATALARYAAARIPRYERVRQFADQVEHAADAAEFAERYVAFSHWMLN